MVNTYLYFRFQDSEYEISAEEVSRIFAYAQRMSWAIQENPESSTEAKDLAEDFAKFANKKVQNRSIWD